MTTILNIKESHKPDKKDVLIFSNLQNTLNDLEVELKQSPVYLSQNDFLNGTYRIKSPGYYQLSEDIFFNPNPSTWNSDLDKLEGPDWFPTPSQTEGGSNAEYPIAPFGGYHLGFFAAITVESDNVIIDLNNHTISQHVQHYLQQRFFSIIELASTPFIPPQGPSTFGPIETVNNVKIKNGFFGLSSHSAIHGNNMKNVILENLNIYNFEQAGIALNGGENILLDNITIDNSSMNVFVNSQYSQSRFIKSFLVNAINNGNPSITIKGEIKTAQDLLNELVTEMDSVYNDIVNLKRNVTSEFYKNPDGIIDGNIYGIILNVSGVAVNDFVQEIQSETINNNNILLKNVTISKLFSNATEVVGLFNYSTELNDTYTNLKVQTGPVGDVFRILDVTDVNQYYKPNVLANAQCYVSKYKVESGASRSSIEEYIYDTWIVSDVVLNPPNIKYVLGGDSMAHIMKGSIGLFLSGSQNTKLYNIRIQDVSNIGSLGNSDKVNDITNAYMGNLTRGLAVVSTQNISVHGMTIKNIFSKTGTSTGIDFINLSKNIDILDYYIYNIKSANYLDTGEYPNSKGLTNIIAGNKNVENLRIVSIE